MRANGFESIRNQDIKKSKRQKSRSKIHNAFVVQLLEKATSVRADDCGVGFGVLVLQFRDEFCEGALAIAQLQTSLSRALNPDGAVRQWHIRRRFSAAATASGGETALAQRQKLA